MVPAGGAIGAGVTYNLAASFGGTPDSGSGPDLCSSQSTALCHSQRIIPGVTESLPPYRGIASRQEVFINPRVVVSNTAERKVRSALPSVLRSVPVAFTPHPRSVTPDGSFRGQDSVLLAQSDRGAAAIVYIGARVTQRWPHPRRGDL